MDPTHTRTIDREALCQLLTGQGDWPADFQGYFEDVPLPGKFWPRELVNLPLYGGCTRMAFALADVKVYSGLGKDSRYTRRAYIVCKGCKREVPYGNYKEHTPSCRAKRAGLKITSPEYAIRDALADQGLDPDYYPYNV